MIAPKPACADQSGRIQCDCVRLSRTERNECTFNRQVWLHAKACARLQNNKVRNFYVGKIAVKNPRLADAIRATARALIAQQGQGVEVLTTSP